MPSLTVRSHKNVKAVKVVNRVRETLKKAGFSTKPFPVTIGVQTVARPVERKPVQRYRWSPE